MKTEVDLPPGIPLDPVGRGVWLLHWRYTLHGIALHGKEEITPAPPSLQGVVWDRLAGSTRTSNRGWDVWGRLALAYSKAGWGPGFAVRVAVSHLARELGLASSGTPVPGNPATRVLRSGPPPRRTNP